MPKPTTEFRPILPEGDYDPVFYAYQNENGDLVVDWNDQLDPVELRQRIAMSRRRELATRLTQRLTRGEIAPSILVEAQGLNPFSMAFALAMAGTALQATILEAREINEQLTHDHFEKSYGLEGDQYRRAILPNKLLGVAMSPTARETLGYLEQEFGTKTDAYWFGYVDLSEENDFARSLRNYIDERRRKPIYNEKIGVSHKPTSVSPTQARETLYNGMLRARQNQTNYDFDKDLFGNYDPDSNVFHIGGIPRMTIMAMNPAVIIDAVMRLPGMSREFDRLVPYIFGLSEHVKIWREDGNDAGLIPESALRELLEVLRETLPIPTDKVAKRLESNELVPQY